MFGYCLEKTRRLEKSMKKNNVAMLRPELVKEWDYEVNGELRPEECTVGSNKKVGWKCKNGHKWMSTIKSRYHGRNCPYCASVKVLGGFSDLATLYPDLVAEWGAGNEIKPTEVSAYSNKMVLWKCTNGHTWQAIIADRTRGSGCPYCSTRTRGQLLITNYPELAKQWSSRNTENVEEITSGSGKKVWWKCSAGHEWQATVNMRTAKGTGCPYCAGKKHE